MARLKKQTTMERQRNRRDPAERAQAELDTARRVLERVTRKQGEVYEQYVRLTQEVVRLEKRVGYLAANPDLAGDVDAVPDDDEH